MKDLKDLSLLRPEDWAAFLKYRKATLQGFLTGIPELDAVLGGLTGIVGIQGEPGSCKSTFALQIAVYNAMKKVPVLIIDRENGKNRFRQRILSQLNHISRKEVMKCPTAKLKSYYRKLAELSIYVETSYTVDLESVKDYLVQMYAKYKKPMLLVCDSLQALPKAKEDERMALQEWLEGLDQLKLDFEGNLVIIMTSEKSRGKYEVASKDGGKGTGAIEFKCEQLLDMRTMPGGSVIALQLVKNRDGICTDDFYLVKQLANPEPSSFIFRLAAATQEDIQGFIDEEDSRDSRF